MVARRGRRRHPHAAGPGKPVTIVDSGIDVTHPEFLGRAEHRDAERAGAGADRRRARHVGRLARRGAPVNGVGLVGIYPEAVLRSWDAAKAHGTELETSEIVQGILAAANGGPGVVNLSLGSATRSS